jgi:hypothetical protein
MKELNVSVLSQMVDWICSGKNVTVILKKNPVKGGNRGGRGWVPAAIS